VPSLPRREASIVILPTVLVPVIATFITVRQKNDSE